MRPGSNPEGSSSRASRIDDIDGYVVGQELDASVLAPGEQASMRSQSPRAKASPAG